MDKVIFREYDIRGIVPETINEQMAYTLGQSFGSYIKSNKVLVGYDNRLSSTKLSESLIKGLLSTGVEVINLGLITTPMYYFARHHLNIWGGLMITASHNPADHNGFKISFDDKGNAVGQEICDFRDFTFKNEFIKGNGILKEYDIKDEYIDLMIKSLKFDKKIKVVVDCGNGTGSIIIKDILDKLPIEYDLLFAESDGTFPHHHPDPSVSSNMVDLQKRVVELNYDFGFAIDADGDRVRIVDELGNIIDTDIYMAIMYRYLYNNLKNKTALYDVKCSRALVDELNKLGLKQIMNRTGNSYMYRKIFEENIDFGGEYSGHLFFKDKWPGFDDGIYAGLRIAELLSLSNTSLSLLTKDINKYHTTDEIKVKIDEQYKFLVIEKLKEYLDEQKYNYQTIDGVRIEFDNGWALVRASNTGANLTMRFEANNLESLETIKEEIYNEVLNIISTLT